MHVGLSRQGGACHVMHVNIMQLHFCRVRLEVLSGKGGFPVCFKPDGGRFEVSANTLKLCNGTPYSLRLSFEPKLTVK